MRVSWCSLVLLLCTLWEPCALFSSIYYFLPIKKNKNKSIVGALQYVTITRPELAYSVNKVCQYMQTPSESHWKVVKRILRYLKGTLHHGLHLRKLSALDLVAFCDDDWPLILMIEDQLQGFVCILVQILSLGNRRNNILSLDQVPKQNIEV